MTIRESLRFGVAMLSISIPLCGALSLTGCGLLGSGPTKTVLKAIREPAIEVLTNVINDRMDAMVDKETATCWELPEGFQSGEEDLDDDERGAFAVCWARSAE